MAQSVNFEACTVGLSREVGGLKDLKGVETRHASGTSSRSKQVPYHSRVVVSIPVHPYLPLPRVSPHTRIPFNCQPSNTPTAGMDVHPSIPALKVKPQPIRIRKSLMSNTCPAPVQRRHPTLILQSHLLLRPKAVQTFAPPHEFCREVVALR